MGAENPAGLKRKCGRSSFSVIPLVTCACLADAFEWRSVKSVKPLKTVPLMKTFLCFFAAFVVFSVRSVAAPSQLSGTNSSVVAAAAAADDERQAATMAGERSRLEAIFSDDLRYAHSSGKVDTKTSYVDSLVSHQTVYESFDYKERTFLPAAPGIVLMTGRVIIHARNGDQRVENDLNFLAVWREENGHWRFLSWQSSKNPPAAPSPDKK